MSGFQSLPRTTNTSVSNRVETRPGHRTAQAERCHHGFRRRLERVVVVHDERLVVNVRVGVARLGHVEAAVFQRVGDLAGSPVTPEPLRTVMVKLPGSTWGAVCSTTGSEPAATSSIMLFQASEDTAYELAPSRAVS